LYGHVFTQSATATGDQGYLVRIACHCNLLFDLSHKAQSFSSAAGCK
jgi:hypothetical protein